MILKLQADPVLDYKGEGINVVKAQVSAKSDRSQVKVVVGLSEHTLC